MVFRVNQVVGVVDSVLGLSISGFRQTPSSVTHPDIKPGPPIELPSLWGMPLQTESLLMMHPGEQRVEDSGKFLQTPDTDPDTKRGTIRRTASVVVSTFSFRPEVP